jgi:hypothetical protein
MQAYFNLIFSESGLLLVHASEDAIKHLRQVLLCFYKLEMEYSAEVEEELLDSFVTTDSSLTFSDDDEFVSTLETARHITENIFRVELFDHKDIIPKHGPGAVATGEKLENKWVFSRLFDSIHQVYPYYDYFVVGGPREILDRLDWYKGLARQKSGVAKVILVPKDSRGPRLISCEPLEYQWIQQGLGRKVMSHLESNPLTKGRINFQHQEVNQLLAMSSSIDRRYATLDLKDASDRVSLELVRQVFKRTPSLLKALEATRSSATTLPNGRVVQLKKFAPMGSALCFPIEAYVFWVLLVAARIRRLKMPLDEAVKDIFVYGDDIIVPTGEADRCIQVLESAGLKVNTQKSCIHGFFRESCGVDAFKGINVTPKRVKTPWSGSPVDAEAYASYVTLCNDLKDRGYRAAYEYVYARVTKLYGPIPFGTKESGFPCIHVPLSALAESCNELRFKHRWNASFQHHEFRLPKLSSKRKKSSLDGWPRLLRDMVQKPVGDPSTVIIPRMTQIKYGWTPVGTGVPASTWLPGPGA